MTTTDESTSARRMRRTRAILASSARLVLLYPYVVTCVLITLLFLGGAIGTGKHLGMTGINLGIDPVRFDIGIRDPEGALLGRRMIGPVLLMGLFAMLDSTLRAWRRRRGGSQGHLMRIALGIFLERWWWKRLALAVIGFLSFAFTYLAYRNLKSFTSLVNFRTYDPELLDLDRWMAFGHTPGTLLHDALGTTWAAFILSWVYLAFIPLVPITVSAALTFVERMREAYVYVAAMMWCWVLGTASYYAIPTLGPFGGARQLFDDLPFTNVTRVQGSLLKDRFDLMSDPIGEVGVGGVAGFASLHVGIVFMAFLMMRYYRQKTLAAVAMAFLIPTVLATVYFGWHYLIDDIAGFLIGWMSVVLGRITVYPRIVVTWRRRRRSPTSGQGPAHAGTQEQLAAAPDHEAAPEDIPLHA